MVYRFIIRAFASASVPVHGKTAAFHKKHFHSEQYEANEQYYDSQYYRFHGSFF